VARKKDSKKARRPIKEKGNTATQEFDFGKFQQMFDKWKDECGASGAKIGMTSAASLLDVIENHGVVARPYTKDKLSRDEGASTVIDILNEWETDAAVLETVDKLALEKIIKKLENMADSKADPRNIKFTVPNPGDVDEDTGDYDVTTIYGHYRTKDYVEFRNILAEIENSKVNKETQGPVNEDWYKESKNEAKPPMWQALFAGGKNGKGDIVSVGLLQICYEARELVKNAKISNVILEVDDDNQGLLAADVYKIPAVQKWINGKVGNASAPGPGINTDTLHWIDRPMHREIGGTKFPVQGLKQSEFVKRASDFDKYAGTIATFTLKISRRQVRKLATLTGNCKKYPGRDVVYHISKDTKKEVSKSWQQIIGQTS